ncbi:MAG: hypothetical protein ACR2P3_10115 [Geminicoccaceae bacterium]
MATPSLALYRLMEIPRRLNLRLKGESLLCYDIANMLRAGTLDGSLRAVWTHPANEGKRTPLIGAILKAVGLIPGTPDYLFAWQGGGGFIEIKTPPVRPSSLSPSQRDFKEWCAMLGVNHAVCTTPDQVWQTLVTWGAVVEQPKRRSA